MLQRVFFLVCVSNAHMRMQNTHSLRSPTGQRLRYIFYHHHMDPFTPTRYKRPRANAPTSCILVHKYKNVWFRGMAIDNCFLSSTNKNSSRNNVSLNHVLRRVFVSLMAIMRDASPFFVDCTRTSKRVVYEIWCLKMAIYSTPCEW